MPPRQGRPAPPTHWASVEQLVKQVVVSGLHLYGEQSVGVVDMQLPLESHFLTPKMADPRH